MNDDAGFLKKKIKHMQEEIEYLHYQLKGMTLIHSKVAMKTKTKALYESEHLELFDEAFYLKTYPDVAKINITPYEHYIRYGKAIGRRCF